MVRQVYRRRIPPKSKHQRCDRYIKDIYKENTKIIKIIVIIIWVTCSTINVIGVRRVLTRVKTMMLFSLSGWRTNVTISGPLTASVYTSDPFNACKKSSTLDVWTARQSSSVRYSTSRIDSRACITDCISLCGNRSVSTD